MLVTEPFQPSVQLIRPLVVFGENLWRVMKCYFYTFLRDIVGTFVPWLNTILTTSIITNFISFVELKSKWRFEKKYCERIEKVDPLSSS